MIASFFAPAQRLMSRLTYPQKFTVLVFFLLIPAIVLFVQFWFATDGNVEFTERELWGLDYIPPLFDLFDGVIRHGGVTVAAQYEAAQPTAQTAAVAQIDAAIAAINALDTSYAHYLRDQAEWTQWQADWRTLQTDLPQLTSEQIHERHLALLNSGLVLVQLVANESNLILDPELASYYLMDALLIRLPVVLVNLGDIHMISLESLLSAGTVLHNAERITFISSRAREEQVISRRGLDFTFERVPALETRLRTRIDALYNATSNYLAFIAAEIIAPPVSAVTLPAAARPDALLERTRILLAQFDDLGTVLRVELADLLNARMDRLVTTRALLALGALIAVGAAAYLITGFYLSVQATIRQLQQSADRLVRGDFTPVQLDSRDELAEIGAAFQRVAAELALTRDRALESSRLKDEFLATMSHEFRTPLNSIIGFTDILLTGIRGQIDDAARRMLERVSASSHHLLNLINEVLDIAKIEAGRLEIVPRPAKLRWLVNQWEQELGVLAKQKDLSFAVTLEPTLPEEVVLDAERVTQIMQNLISNAVKFTNEGTVALDVRSVGDQLLLKVSDTGIGIPPQALEYIFDEFRQVDGSYTRERGGTGLGLAIVKKLAILMGGGVTVSSQPGAGSAFTIALPLITRSVPVTAVPAAVAEPA